ncbi:MAG: M23 family metallopeptidase [Gemmatimonadota bacterium]|nr:MAG: M23 family metallopeptidase [Gemmatimonadota bacterium]
MPRPPEPVSPPQEPPVVELKLDERLREIEPPGPLAPRIHWTPAVPDEGSLVVLTLEPEPRGLPVFEVRARARDRDVALSSLDGGAYFGLVAAPLNVPEIPVEIDITLADGTRITRRLTLLVETLDFAATRLRVASRFTAPDERAVERIRREREIVRAALATVTTVPLWNGAFIMPRDDATTSPYGQRRLFNNELRSRHTGLDIRGRTGDPVYAANSGRVILARNLFYTGNAVYIDHGLGIITGYFHLSKHEVTEGQWVEKGQLIGRVGATGRVTGPHLHWGLYLQGAALDPSTLLAPAFARISDRLPAPTVIVE